MIIEVDRAKKKVSIKKEPKAAKTAESKGAEAKPSDESFITIDHPKDGEAIHPHHYAVRIGAGGGSAVEISVDGGDWKPCRHTAGYYWFDWHNIPSGSHQLVARLQLQNGKTKKSKSVRCKVG